MAASTINNEYASRSCFIWLWASTLCTRGLGGRRRRRRRLDIDKGLGDELRGDGALGLHRERLNVDLLHVHDAREIAETIEEDRQIVIAAVDRHCDRPFGVRI